MPAMGEGSGVGTTPAEGHEAKGVENDDDDDGSGASATPPSHSAECPICRWPMHPRAKYCLKCKTYQGWRKILGLGVTVPSLILGILSVLAVLGPRVHGVLTRHRSDISFVSYTVGPKSLTVVITNTGTRAGFIESGTLRIQGAAKANPQVDVLEWTGTDARHELIIEPGGWRTVDFSLKDKGDLFEGDGRPPSTNGGCKYEITLRVLNFDLTETSRVQTTACRPARGHQ